MFYWPGVKKKISETIKKHEKSQVDTIENVGVNLCLQISQDVLKKQHSTIQVLEKYIFITIDYCIRKKWERAIDKKSSKNVTKFISEVVLREKKV